MLLEARLRAFAALAREKSFSRAASALYISQPGVSKHIASLEAEVGVRLVTRPGALLTPAGELLAGYVLRAEALLATATRALGAISDPESGTLAVAASGIPGTYLFPALLTRFADEHRRRRRRAPLDLGGCHRTGARPRGRARRRRRTDSAHELVAEELVEDEIVLVGPPSLRDRRLTPSELEAFTWVSREEGSSTRGAVEAARKHLGLHAPARSSCLPGKPSSSPFRRRRDRGHQPIRNRGRDRRGHAHRARRASLAPVTHDHRRACGIRAAHPARRAFPRTPPPPRSCSSAGRPERHGVIRRAAYAPSQHEKHPSEPVRPSCAR